MARRIRKTPKGLKEITQLELTSILKKHDLFCRSKGRRGVEITELKDYDFTGLSFTGRWLNNIDFRGSWFQSSDLSRCNVNGANFEGCWVEDSKSGDVPWLNGAGAIITGTLWAIK
jgi:uncharacterized protein YjbI with pentapeptide repeats